MKVGQFRSAGFSLMEVNMAVFVMAIGILGMVALFPLGLREGVQGRQDLKQAMFADHVHNQLIAILSDTNLIWSEWVKLDRTSWPVAVNLPTLKDDMGGGFWARADLPNTQVRNLDFTEGWYNGSTRMNDNQYRVFFQLLGGDKSSKLMSRYAPSASVMGIGVRSTEAKVTNYDQYTNNIMYYAEVKFQGEP